MLTTTALPVSDQSPRRGGIHDRSLRTRFVMAGWLLLLMSTVSFIASLTMAVTVLPQLAGDPIGFCESFFESDASIRQREGEQASGAMPFVWRALLGITYLSTTAGLLIQPIIMAAAVSLIQTKNWQLARVGLGLAMLPLFSPCLPLGFLLSSFVFILLHTSGRQLFRP